MRGRASSDRVLVATIMVLALSCTRCYHYAITSNGGDAEAYEHESETKWAFF